MTLTQQIITIALCTAGTVLTRALPFLVFTPGKAVPPFVRYLGKALPVAVFGMLVVYCLKDVSVMTGKEESENDPDPSEVETNDGNKRRMRWIVLSIVLAIILIIGICAWLNCGFSIR